jgi:uncharacterized protein
MDTPAPEVSSPLAPVAPAERVELLDIFRGFALLGVLIANMRGFSGPLAAFFDNTLMWQEPVNRALQFLIDTFVTGKFIMIFSFLFGVGVAIQIERAASRSLSFLTRRFGFLLGLGLIHMFLLWWGDILVTYSVFGLVLLLFRNRQSKTLLYWAAGFHMWPIVVFGGMTLASLIKGGFPLTPQVTPEELARIILVYSTGSYFDILPERVKEARQILALMPLLGTQILGVFVFGVWVWRKGILRELGSHQELLVRCQRWGAGLGFPLTAAFMVFYLVTKPNPHEPTPEGLLVGVVSSIATPALSLFYLSTIARLVAVPWWRGALSHFAPVGRMALTNYLMQTLVCTWIFYGYGLGFFGRVGPWPGLALSVGIFAGQIVLSRIWLGRFSQGPAEAAWRGVTYARWRSS